MTSTAPAPMTAAAFDVLDEAERTAAHRYGADDDGAGARAVLLAQLVDELRTLNAKIERLDEDLRPLIPFRLGRRR